VTPNSGVLLYAKRAGLTSFSSLSLIKKALVTGKVGHTGTLDSFADGLLVVLTGGLTRLAPLVSGFDKSYRALIRFGAETDTLDPTGTITHHAPLPTQADFCRVLPHFTGAIRQTPPAYSAIHIEGKRASDRVRNGQAVTVPEREITIYAIEMLAFSGEYALIDVRCSKGTYIRALARDIALACGSRAHLANLRRTAVGDFALAEALFADELPPLVLPDVSEMPSVPPSLPVGNAALQQIRTALLSLTPPLAARLGLTTLTIADTHIDSFFHGKTPDTSWFVEAEDALHNAFPAAVFSVAGDFCGIVRQQEGKIQYGMSGN
jgi:tRNA pseudouridine55 synthase